MFIEKDIYLISVNSFVLPDEMRDHNGPWGLQTTSNNFFNFLTKIKIKIKVKTSKSWLRDDMKIHEY